MGTYSNIKIILAATTSMCSYNIHVPADFCMNKFSHDEIYSYSQVSYDRDQSIRSYDKGVYSENEKLNLLLQFSASIINNSTPSEPVMADLINENFWDLF